MSTVMTDRRGVGAVHALAGKAGWFFRELPAPDEGIDAHLEGATAGRRPDGRLLALQIKTGPSHFTELASGLLRVYLDEHNVRYWFRYSLPVVLVLHLPDEDETLWREVTADTLIRTRRDGLAIDLDPSQRFGVEAFTRLRELVDAGLPEADEALDQALRGRRAALDLRWVEELDAGARLLVDARVDQARGQAELRLIKDRQLYEEGLDDRVWFFNPETEFAEELRRLFPWADFAIDREHYRRRTRVEFLDAQADWQPGDREYLWREDADFDAWFGDHYEGRLGPWGVRHDGGLELWRLELSLNDLGRSLLRAEQDEMYDAAMSQIEEEESRQDLRSGGTYRAGSHDAAGRHVDLVILDSDGWSEVIRAGDGFLADPEQVAAIVLADALDDAPTEAQVRAFARAFASVIADGDWQLPFSMVEAWLSETSG